MTLADSSLNMRWIVIFMAAAMLTGCARLEFEQEQQRADIAIAETRIIVAECEAKRLLGRVSGYSGAYFCADKRYRNAWTKARYPNSDLILRVWTRKGLLSRALDAGEISQTQYALMLDDFEAQIFVQLDTRNAREAQIRANNRTNMLLLWQATQPTYGSNAPTYRSPTTCTTIAPSTPGSGQSTIAVTNCY